MTLNKLGAFYKKWGAATSEQKSNNFILMHLVSELAEAFSCIRHNMPDLYFSGKEEKPEGLGPELADIIILTAKLAALHGIDLERMIKLKHEYNTERRGAKER